MLHSFIAKTKKSLEIKKKTIISFFVTLVLFLFAFLCCSLSANFVSNLHESIARKMGNNTYVCEVISSRENETYREFFTYADDLAGAEIKESVDTFILCEEKNDIPPSELFLSSSNSVEINSIFQYTVWRFDLTNYNFKTLTGAPVDNLSGNEIYINTKLSHILMRELQCDEVELVGRQFNIQTKTSLRQMKIIDIITNFEEIGFGPYFPGTTIITNFAYTATLFDNSKFVAILRGGFLSKTYELKYLDSGIRKMREKGIEYYQHLFRLSNNNLVDDGIQNFMINTRQFYNGDNKKMVIFITIPLLSLVFICIASALSLVGKEVYLSLSVSSLVYFTITTKLSPFLILHNTIILISNAFASVVLVLFISLVICVYLLFEHSQNEINKKGKRCQIKI